MADNREGGYTGNTPSTWSPNERPGVWSLTRLGELQRESEWPGTAKPIEVDYAVVAGGGGGGIGYDLGYFASGGGGGGGVILSSGTFLTGIQYKLEVGAGGSQTSSGTASTFSSFVAIGGGGGAPAFQVSAPPGQNGGCGGGGTYAYSTNGIGGSGIPGQGFNGGGGNSANSRGGGGGGSAFIGTTGTAVPSGGYGKLVDWTGINSRFGGGGGGGPNGPGGLGGGGTGGTPPTAGTVSTGGGGGGVQANSRFDGGVGGTGTILIRVPDTVSATFSAGVSSTSQSAAGYKVFQITATSTTSEYLIFEA
jgi:hypothetical protein